MSKSLELNIISAEKTVYTGQVTSIQLPGSLGEFSIHPDHAPLISSLQKGIILYNTDGATEELSINGGFVEVKQNIVTVCIS